VDLPDIPHGLSMLGLTWVEHDDEEADDVIVSLVRLDLQRATSVLSTGRD